MKVISDTKAERIITLELTERELGSLYVAHSQMNYHDIVGHGIEEGVVVINTESQDVTFHDNLRKLLKQ